MCGPLTVLSPVWPNRLDNGHSYLSMIFSLGMHKGSFSYIPPLSPLFDFVPRRYYGSRFLYLFLSSLLVVDVQFRRILFSSLRDLFI